MILQITEEQQKELLEHEGNDLELHVWVDKDNNDKIVRMAISDMVQDSTMIEFMLK